MQTSLNVDKNGKYINIKANLGMAITPGTEVADNFPQDLRRNRDPQPNR